jgi:hypothetical protein
VRLEVDTKLHVHQKFENFWTNITSTMTYPNFQNRPKNGLHLLGVNYNVSYGHRATTSRRSMK